MGSPAWEKVQEVFHQVVDLPPAERGRTLAQFKESEPELLQEVNELLAADGSAADRFMETPWWPDFIEGAGADPDAVILQPGQLVQGRYRIVREVGHGGMGRVYEAMDLVLEVRIALKTLRSDVASNAQLARRFRQEVRSAHRVTHPNVCRIYHLEGDGADSTATADARPIRFLTMEFLEGVTLQQHLAVHGPMPPAEVIRVARQVAAGLDAAHGAGVCHCDIKPGNIMLCGEERERVVITDFGLARWSALNAAATSTRLTATGAVAGTFGYMAPEQMQGARATPAADIYAFGVVLQEMFTGLRKETPEDAEAEDPSDLAEVPLRWRGVVESCLAYNPTLRPASAGEVVEGLEGKRRGFRRMGLVLTAGQMAAVVFIAVSLAAVSLFLMFSRFNKQAVSGGVTPGALVYLAPLQNNTGNGSMSGVSEMLRASLSQSTQANLLDDARANDILANMKQPPDTAVTPQIGREIAMRSGAVRVIFPRLSKVDDSYQLDLDVEQPSETPARARQVWQQHWQWKATGNTAAGAGSASGAVRNGADWLRRLVGESADDIARLSAPPEDVTTANWDALADYALAEKLSLQTRREEAVAALQDAVAKDPKFALANALLGDILVNIGRREEGFQAYAAALDAAAGERLSLRERTRIKGLVGQDTGNLQAAEAAYREYTLYYPHDYLGWFRRGLPLYSMGRLPEAVQVLEKAHDAAPARPLPLSQLALTYLVLGNDARVDAILADLKAHYSRDYYLLTLVPVQISRAEYDAAAQSIRELAGSTQIGFAAVTMSANLQAERGDFMGAVAALTDRLNHVPSDAALLTRRAHLLCRLQQYAACLSDIKAATASDRSAAVLIDASDVLGKAVQVADARTARELTQELQRLAALPPSRYDGLLGEVSLHQIKGEALLASGDVSGAVEQFRQASALNPTVELREPLARALESSAARANGASAAKPFLEEALQLRQPFTSNAARIWAHWTFYPPGTYADNLDATASLAGRIGDLQAASAMRRKLSQVRTEPSSPKASKETDNSR